MAHPEPALDREDLERALIAFLDAAGPAQEAYRLVGTGAALVQGVDLPTGDLDILVREREAVDAFGAALGGYPCLEPPAWLAEARQYYGNYDVHGVEVGISTVEVDSEADTVETFGRGPWAHYVLVPCGGHAVPAVALELRLITELYRNRPDRIEPLLAHLEAHGCDLAFILRGIDGAGMSETVRERVRGRLAEAAFRPVAELGRRPSS